MKKILPLPNAVAPEEERGEDDKEEPGPRGNAEAVSPADRTQQRQYGGWGGLEGSTAPPLMRRRG